MSPGKLTPVFDCEPDGTRAMAFRCPKCGKRNRHGISHGDTPSHRAAHCRCWPGGYFIRLADPTLDGVSLIADILALVVPTPPTDTRPRTHR